MLRLRPAQAVLGGTLVLGLGCGLRSNALDDFDGEIGEITEGSDPDEGSCGMPKHIPETFDTFVLSGRLRGSGSELGPCGRDDGPEGVYAFSPAAQVDVTIRADAGETTFVPTIRVERDVCGEARGVAELCASDFLRPAGASDQLVDGLARHFLAQAGSTYFITIDSPADTRGDYRVELQTGPPGLEQCGVHGETITYAPGGTFSWINEFSAGYGRVSSRCGAPGKENMFRLVMGQSAWVSVFAQGSEGFVPVLSLRTGCSATTEIECTAAAGTAASAEWFVEAGEHYLTIDNAGTAGGEYQLFVDFG
jgi:hypothetical protein